MTNDELIASPEAKRVARAIMVEPWVSDFLEADDRIMRRLGSALALQELQVRMGLIIEPWQGEKKRGRPRKLST